jgi:serine acetyltransferase
VGAGAVVIDDVAANTTVVGCPARVVSRRSPGWQE